MTPFVFTRAGDIVAPGPIVITILYPRVVNGRATVLYSTPVDQDYKGVRVLERSLLQTGTSPGETILTLTSSSVANPTQILTSTSHGLTTGDAIIIAGHGASIPDINGPHIVTVVDADEFTIPVNVTTSSTGGTVIRSDTFILSAAPTADPTNYTIEITGGTGIGQDRNVSDRLPGGLPGSERAPGGYVYSPAHI